MRFRNGDIKFGYGGKMDKDGIVEWMQKLVLFFAKSLAFIEVSCTTWTEENYNVFCYYLTVNHKKNYEKKNQRQ